MKNLNFTFQLKALLVLVIAAAISCTENTKKEKNANHTTSTDSIFTISLEKGLNNQRAIGLKRWPQRFSTLNWNLRLNVL